MIKNVVAVALISLAGGTWLYLDCLNKQEQNNAEQMHQGVDNARAEAKKRTEAKAAFEYQILATMTSCQAAAEKAKVDYMSLIEKAVPPRKKDPFVIPKAVEEQAESILTAAKTECQQTYDTRLQKGL